MDAYDESRFKEKIKGSINHVKKILGTERQHRIADDVPHTYKDKYELSEWIAKGTIGATMSFLFSLGLSMAQLKSMISWAKDDKQTVTLCFSSEHQCIFDKEHLKSVESDSSVVIDTSSLLGKAASKIFSVAKVKEYWFTFTNQWKLTAYPGNEKDKNLLINSRSHSKCTLKMSSKTPPPHPEKEEFDSIEIDVTNLLNSIDVEDGEEGEEQLLVSFSIDRDSMECRTPRRNPQIEAASDQFSSINYFFHQVSSYFSNTLLYIDSELAEKLPHSDWSQIDSIPMSFVPLMEPEEYHKDQATLKKKKRKIEEKGKEAPALLGVDGTSEGKKSKKKKKSSRSKSISAGAGDDVGAAASASAVAEAVGGERVPAASSLLSSLPTIQLSSATRLNQFIDEEEPSAMQTTLTLQDATEFIRDHQRALNEKLLSIDQTHTASTGSKLVITALEASQVTLAQAIMQLCNSFQSSIDFLERMLHNQLVAAIGKEVTPDDFQDYMVFHARRLFRPQFQPDAFCYAIRRPEHTPEGVISLERYREGKPGNHEPLSTIGMNMKSAPEGMSFALDASTRVQLHGDVFVHGCLNHRFADSEEAPFRVSARARQFSGFVLMLGRVVSGSLLDISDAIIVANKTEVGIPLDPETIPSAKEFKEAIDSMSPAQQRFAKAYRSMQLSHTLFALVVVQIKPQLERLLNLDPDALTKKIQLTEDLKTLFMKYQIPSDLVSYGGKKEASVEAKVKEVEGHVASMLQMIDESKKEELRQREQELSLAVMDNVVDTGGRAANFIDDDALLCDEIGSLEEQSMELSMQSVSFTKSAKSTSPSFFGRVARAVGGTSRSSSVAVNGLSGGEFPESECVAISADCMPTGSAAPEMKLSAGKKQDVSALEEDTKNKPSTPGDQQSPNNEQSIVSTAAAAGFDVTAIPRSLTSAFDKLEEPNFSGGGSVRPTILNVGDFWDKKEQRGLMREPEHETLYEEERKTEKQRAFDLLDALSRSGSLAIEDAEVHVVIVNTHCFEKTIMNSVIQDSINPVEKIERSLCALATVIHGGSIPLRNMIEPVEESRLMKYNKELLE